MRRTSRRRPEPEFVPWSLAELGRMLLWVPVQALGCTAVGVGMYLIGSALKVWLR